MNLNKFKNANLTTEVTSKYQEERVITFSVPDTFVRLINKNIGERKYWSLIA